MSKKTKQPSMFGQLINATWMMLELLLFAILTIALVGCDSSPLASEIRQESQQSRESTALFHTITHAMNDLDQAVDVNVRQMRLRLDRNRSTDKQPVMATIFDNPRVQGNQFTILHVSTKNSDFVTDSKNPKVAPGDIVHFFGKIEGQISDDRAEKSDDKADRAMLAQFNKKTFYKLIVRDVIDNNTLILEDGLEQQIPALKEPENQSIEVGPEPIVIYREVDYALQKMEKRLNTWVTKGEPKIGWEPTPDESGVGQLVDRLNQWIITQPAPKTTPDWRHTYISRLPEKIRELPAYQGIDDLKFRFADGRFLQESIWLRDIAHKARSRTTPLAQAEWLFDWVVRNIQLQTHAQMQGRMQRPWHTLAFGRGTAEDRAWVFSLLARQLYLDVVTLYPRSNSNLIPHPISALFVDGKLYLFDPTLGLPIPNADGSSIATLSEVVLDDGLLRQLDLSADAPYPLKKDDFASVVALIESTPQYFSTRMKMLQHKLVGDDRVVLFANTDRLAGQLEQMKLPEGMNIQPAFWTIAGDTTLNQINIDQHQRLRWANEFKVFNLYPRIWKGRVLEFKGNKYRLEIDHLGNHHWVYSDEHDPMSNYRMCRMTDDYLLRSRNAMASLAKFHANRWMGLHFAQQDDYLVAFDFLDKRMLNNRLWPGAANILNRELFANWHDSVLYNLARTHESLANYYQDLGRTLSLAEVASGTNSGTIITNLVLGQAILAAAAEHRTAAIDLYQRSNERKLAESHQNQANALEQTSRALSISPSSGFFRLSQDLLLNAVINEQKRHVQLSRRYQVLSRSPQNFGDRLRARRLQETNTKK